MMILPRQARDKHRGNSLKDRFVAELRGSDSRELHYGLQDAAVRPYYYYSEEEEKGYGYACRHPNPPPICPFIWIYSIPLLTTEDLFLGAGTVSSKRSGHHTSCCGLAETSSNSCATSWKVSAIHDIECCALPRILAVTKENTLFSFSGT
jgi:hypothetical protein